jgi:protein-S-isoprenylcysteine O-methyltransferase Ste14
MLLTLMLFFVYVWATVAFGLRFSNVTHRGILDTGPYRYIRHPAYATKNLAWWTESLSGFGSPWQFVYLAGLNAIYITRAITEERHLSTFQDYRDYMQRVRWRFIPGVF